MNRETLVRNTLNGIQTIYRFKNNYGASVIKHEYRSHYQLVVIKYDDEDDEITYFDFCYDTYIAKDILYGLNQVNLDNILKEIEKLK